MTDYSPAGNCLTVLRTLRAVRQFRADPVPNAALHAILQVARWTGSAKNTEPWELVVVSDRTALTELATCGQYAGHLSGAALALALVMERAGQAFDAGRLAQNIMVAAWAQGIGSCIASLFPDENERRAKELLGVPLERSMHTAISLGYPRDAAALRVSSAPSATRSTVPLGRKSLEAFVSWERYGRRQPN